MTTALESSETVWYPTIVLPDSRGLPRKLWNRDDVRRTLELRLLDAGKRYELIEGEIIEKAERR